MRTGNVQRPTLLRKATGGQAGSRPIFERPFLVIAGGKLIFANA